eukprot:3458865-Amphidinium_carterae.1
MSMCLVSEVHKGKKQLVRNIGQFQRELRARICVRRVGTFGSTLSHKDFPVLIGICPSRKPPNSWSESVRNARVLGCCSWKFAIALV